MHHRRFSFHPHLVRTVAALALTIGCSGVALAAPPTEASVRQLFQLMQAERLLDDAYAQIEPVMRQSMRQAAAGQPLSSAQQQVVDQMPARLGALMRSELSWAKVEADQIAVYRSTFDQAEVDGLIAFYRSPIGQAFVQKMPVVMQKSMASTQGHMQQLLPKLQALMRQIRAEAGLPDQP